MKKLTAVVCVLALVALAAQAEAKMTAGFKGGVNLGDVSGDNAPENTSTRTGIQGGAFLRHGVNEQFGVQGEVLYVQKGVEGDIETEDGDTHTATYKVDYIDIPLLFVAIFPAGDKLGFNIFGGPSFNFNMTAEADIEGHGTEDIENVKSFEFGAVIGGGLGYMLSSVSLVVDVRYSMGATSITEEVAGVSADMKNRGIGIMAGVAFPIGGGE